MRRVASSAASSGLAALTALRISNFSKLSDCSMASGSAPRSLVMVSKLL